MSYHGKLLLQLVVVKNAINIRVSHCGIWVAYCSLKLAASALLGRFSFSYPPGRTDSILDMFFFRKISRLSERYKNFAIIRWGDPSSLNRPIRRTFSMTGFRFKSDEKIFSRMSMQSSLILCALDGIYTFLERTKCYPNKRLKVLFFAFLILCFRA